MTRPLLHKSPRRELLALAVLFCSLSSQTHFTLPKNVWRVSVERYSSTGEWISSGGKVGLPDEYFTLEGYGKRYYDHENPGGNDDLVGLGNMLVTGTDTVSDVIQSFNQSWVALAWGDTLADFTADFFGPDSVVIGGHIINPARDQLRDRLTFRLEYGLTDRFTINFEFPYFLELSQTNKWGWRGGIAENADLQGFVDYHTENKRKFEELINSDYFGWLGDDTVGLKNIYDDFYTPGGKYSLLWAVNGGTDPFANGIYGTDFNPFSTEDTVATTIDSLMVYYHPDVVASGLGDIRWGIDFLLLGSPAWQGESMFSVYGGVDMKLPTARIVGPYNGTKVDKTGRPKQFSQLDLGGGVTQWQFSLFGEFYREILHRLVRVNWRVRYFFNIEGKFPARVTPRGLFTIDPGRVLGKLGSQYRLKRGDVFAATIDGFLELIPDRLSLTAGQQWFFKQRDRYFSDNDEWNAWMAGGTHFHEGYDTRAYQVLQTASVIIHNMHPLKKLGPFPFELEVRGEIPVFTRHTWKKISLQALFSAYFQFW